MAANLGRGDTSLSQLQNEAQRGRKRGDDEGNEASVPGVIPH